MALSAVGAQHSCVVKVFRRKRSKVKVDRFGRGMDLLTKVKRPLGENVPPEVCWGHWSCWEVVLKAEPVRLWDG